MLRGLHKATSNWLGRVVTGIILGLIAVSFAVWGVGDIFRGFGRSTVAKIGKTEITVEQFRQIYSEKLQQLSRQIGRPIPTDQAIALGLPRQMLGQLIAESALDENARQMRLGLSDAEIAKRITSDPSFRGPTGQFDRVRFDQIIRQAGYTEARFVAEQRRIVARREIAEAVSGGLKIPASAIEVQHRFLNEERNIEFIALDRQQAGDIPPPSDDVLSRYFDERKTLYRSPEYRKLDILVLSPLDSARWSEVSDADARKAYEERRARYVTPERREVQQIVFPNMEDARAAFERIGKGEAFEKIAADRGVKDADLTIGTVTKAGMLDSAVAEAAFKLPAGQVSEPVSGRFATVLVRATKVEPEKVRPFEEVAAEIKREIAQENTRKEIADQYNKIEDERGAGAPLADITRKLGFNPRRIESVDRSGRDPSGAPVAGLPAGADVMPAAFASDVGVENDPVKLPDGGYVWFEVISVTPSRERPLSEVKDRVMQNWTDDQIASSLKTRAAELADKLKTSTIEQIAQDAGVKAQTATGLRRGRTSDTVPANTVEQVFRTAKGEVGDSDGARPTQRLVFRVTEVALPKLDIESEESKRIAERLRNSEYEELLTQYVVRLQNDIGTSINETALNLVLSGGSAQN